MAFLSGPRQVGKTTLAHELAKLHADSLYLNWDFIKDRELILSGADQVIKKVLKQDLKSINEIPLVIFDEIHKFDQWKNYLKGYFDYTKGDIKTLVTGSAKLDIYQKGGDSLMGRYFPYHIHPLSVGELLEREYIPGKEIYSPAKLSEDSWDNLFRYGGFPEPYFKGSDRFFVRWQQLRFRQLFEEDIKDLARVEQIKKMEVLAKLLVGQSAGQVNYHNLAKLVQIDGKTAKNWLNVLNSFYYSFTLHPWSKNIARSLIKEPKVFLWDWSVCEDVGSRVETFVAGHLLKAIHYWVDTGLGQYELFYLRDKDKREVDFLIVKNNKPWILIEVKNSAKQSMSENLFYFQKQIQAEHVLQVAFDMPYVERDCFEIGKPVIVPARTFLSQLP